MTLTVDIGNTNIVCGIYKEDKLIWFARFKTDRYRTADEYYALLNSLKSNLWTNNQIDTIIIASVVPDLTRMWQHLTAKYFSSQTLLLNGNSPVGLSFEVDDPGFIGPDLIANALAAWKKYRSDSLIIDFGTATTLQIVTSEGRFKGAIIAPGLRTAANELFNKAALLNEIELTSPEKILGTDSRAAMLSGIVQGHALMVEGFIKLLQEEKAGWDQLTIVSTGGVSELLAAHLPSVHLIDKTLTLDGLYYAAQILTGKIQ